MKKTITAVCFILICRVSVAQICDYWYPLKQGNYFAWNTYNSKGKLTGTNEYSVSSATVNGEEQWFTIHSVLKDDKGKENYSNDIKMSCVANSLYIDMKNFVPQQTLDAYKDMQISFSENSLLFPSAVKPGSLLPDGSVTMKVNNNGLEIAVIEINIKERKVEGVENITTPAGTFSCFKISSTTETITTSFGIKVPFVFKNTEYFSNATGLVKSESYNKDLKLIGITELAAISK